MKGDSETGSGKDLFSVSPLLALLPVTGDVNSLNHLQTFFFARFEKINQELLSHGSKANGDTADEGKEPQTSDSLLLERAMLVKILNWLDVRLDGEAGHDE